MTKVPFMVVQCLDLGCWIWEISPRDVYPVLNTVELGCTVLAQSIKKDFRKTQLPCPILFIAQPNPQNYMVSLHRSEQASAHV